MNYVTISWFRSVYADDRAQFFIIYLIYLLKIVLILDFSGRNFPDFISVCTSDLKLPLLGPNNSGVSINFKLEKIPRRISSIYGFYGY